MTVSVRATRAHVRPEKHPPAAQAKPPLASSRPDLPPALTLTEERGVLVVRLGAVPVGSVSHIGANPRHISEWQWKAYTTGQVPEREEAIARALGAAWSITEWTARLWEYSRAAFGPGPLTKSLTKRIRTALTRLDKGSPEPNDWLAIVTFALDGYGRSGGTPRALIERLEALQPERFTQESHR